jgi:hypothetical protein
MGTPRFGILTYPYPYRYGESPYQYGDCPFFAFFSHAQDRPSLTKNLGNPNAMAHLSSPKFRQPTHCARKSRIRRTREGAELRTQAMRDVRDMTRAKIEDERLSRSLCPHSWDHQTCHCIPMSSQQIQPHCQSQSAIHF